MGSLVQAGGYRIPHHLSDRQLLIAIHERIHKMPTIDDLNTSVSAITTAVGDASAAIKDLANKLANASSVNPADVETAAGRLNQIAAGLEAVVLAVGEPVTAPDEPVPPIDAVAEGATPNPPGSTVAQ